MTPSSVRRQTYQIEIAGNLGAVLRSAFPNMSARRSPPSTVFRVELGDGQPDLVTMLKERGLVLLNARRVSLPEGGVEPA